MSTTEFEFVSYRALGPPLMSDCAPYTTLFRSALVPIDVLAGALNNENVFHGGGRAISMFQRAVHSGLQRGGFSAAVTPVGGEDRKSTRLNSSHVAISYAVFCLRKKRVDTVSVV